MRVVRLVMRDEGEGSGMPGGGVSGSVLRAVVRSSSVRVLAGADGRVRAFSMAARRRHLAQWKSSIVSVESAELRHSVRVVELCWG